MWKSDLACGLTLCCSKSINPRREKSEGGKQHKMNSWILGKSGFIQHHYLTFALTTGSCGGGPFALTLTISSST
uniref:Uncharacterized protein n=1 Tax=Knipowitschia caucasica TaxID=637954 RepID=A0AAV2MSL7_KNICA